MRRAQRKQLGSFICSVFPCSRMQSDLWDSALMVAVNGGRGLPRSALGPNSCLFAMKIADLGTKSALSQIPQRSWALVLRKHVKPTNQPKKAFTDEEGEQSGYRQDSGNQFLQLFSSELAGAPRALGRSWRLRNTSQGGCRVYLMHLHTYRYLCPCGTFPGLSEQHIHLHIQGIKGVLVELVGAAQPAASD